MKTDSPVNLAHALGLAFAGGLGLSSPKGNKLTRWQSREDPYKHLKERAKRFKQLQNIAAKKAARIRLTARGEHRPSRKKVVIESRAVLSEPESS